MAGAVSNGVSAVSKWVLFPLLVGGCALPPAGDAGNRVYPYVHVDVFTDEVLTGNQLAVFLMPEALSDEEMQLIAREMNFSETTFVGPPDQEGTEFRVRIFGRSSEMDFAGHPTIGTAYALARQGFIPAGTERVVLGEGIGPVPVELEWDGDELTFAWMHQLEPSFGRSVDDSAAVAAGLGLGASDMVPGLPVQEVSCGSTFLIVPLASRAAVDRIVIDRPKMMAALDAAGVPARGLMVYSAEPDDDDSTVYSRMLGLSGFEDPATGSAAGPLGSYLVQHGVVTADQASTIISSQGVRMGRPSRLHIDIGVEGDAITRVRVGGQTVFVGEATVVLQ